MNPAATQSVARPSAVVFDVGQVLIAWDPRHLYRKLFSDARRMEWFLSEVCHPEWNVAQDAGRPWPEAEAEAIARHPALEVEIRAFRARWQEMVPGAIDAAVDIVEELAAEEVPLYAITNFAADTFRDARSRFPFFGHFRGFVVSGEIGILKPDPRIFQRLSVDFDVDLGQAVFIDDSAANVEAARRVGMAGVHYRGARDLRLRLAALGLPVACL